MVEKGGQEWSWGELDLPMKAGRIARMFPHLLPQFCRES